MWVSIGIVVTILVLIIIFSVISLFIKDDHNIHHYNDHRSNDRTPYVPSKEHIPDFRPANDRAGLYGERLVTAHLRPLLKEDEYLLTNLLLPLKNGHKTEIDCVLISRRGIFCIEIKNWVGHISGCDEDEFWTQEYDDLYMSDRQHMNPVKQNDGHCAVLERILGAPFRVENIVIFAELEDGDDIDSDYAFTIGQFIEYYRGLNDDEVYVPDLKSIYQKLEGYMASLEELERHKKEARKRFNA